MTRHTEKRPRQDAQCPRRPICDYQGTASRVSGQAIHCPLAVAGTATAAAAAVVAVHEAVAGEVEHAQLRIPARAHDELLQRGCR